MRSSFRKYVFAVFLCLGLTSHTLAQNPETPGRNELAALLKQFETAQGAFNKKLEATEGKETQARVFREETPYPEYAKKLTDLAAKYPGDAVSWEALSWIVRNAECGPLCEEPFAKAMELLSAQHAKHKDSESLFGPLLESAFIESNRYLEAVYQNHPVPETRAKAGFEAAMFIKSHCEMMQRVRTRPEVKINTEQFMGQGLVKKFTTADPAPLWEKAETILEKVKKEHGLVMYKKTLLADLAEKELFEIRNLVVGKKIPEIALESVDGNLLKLSDYKGKVTLVVFWGTWCGHCVKMIPQERALAKRYEGQPFAVVGVNNDNNREKVKLFAVKNQITWPSFFDPEDLVSSRWNIKGWPGIFLIDAQGVVRYRDLRDQPLDRAVEILMGEIHAKK